jgi:small GTP-binding protein
VAEFVKKIVMLGDPMVGKTSLVNRFVKNVFDDKYLSTIGTKPSKKVMKFGRDKLNMMIWDIAGHSYNLHPQYYVGSKGALMVCDLTRRSTLDSLLTWNSSLSNTVGEVPTVVLANKCDVSNCDFEVAEIEKLGFTAMKTSAKTGENVEEAFQSLGEAMLHGRR